MSSLLCNKRKKETEWRRLSSGWSFAPGLSSSTLQRLISSPPNTRLSHKSGPSSLMRSESVLPLDHFPFFFNVVTNLLSLERGKARRKLRREFSGISSVERVEDGTGSYRQRNPEFCISQKLSRAAGPVFSSPHTTTQKKSSTNFN